MKGPKKSTSPTHHQSHGKHIMGSISRIHRDGCFITNARTGEQVENTLLSGEIREKIQQEEKAWGIIRALRDKCIKPQMHNPSDKELREVLDALRTLWLLLPPIKKLKGEKNKTFFLRTLHEINRFRGIDMFSVR